jgi:superkiller protein 3
MPDSRDLLNKLNACESEIEKLFLLAAHERIDGLVPQYQVLNYRIDFAIPDKMIAIEIDGHDYHKTKEQRTHDSQREREIKLALPANWTVIRFTGSEIYQNAALCVDEVLRFINKKSLRNKSLKDNVCALFYRCIPLSLIKTLGNITNLHAAKNGILNGAFLFDQGKYDEAIQAFNKALEIDPKNADAWTGKGQALIKQEKYNDAIQAFDRSLEIDPKNARTWILEGTAFLFYQGKYDKAVQAFDKALEIDPKNSIAWHFKGRTLFNQEKYSDAIQAFDKALETDPNNVTAWHFKGETLIHQEKYDEAVQAFNKALEIDPKNADAWTGKGQALIKQGKHNEALLALKTAVEIDPQNTNDIVWCLIGESLYECGNYDEAHQALEKALNADPNDMHAWLLKSRVLIAQHKSPDEYLPALEMVTKINPQLDPQLAEKINETIVVGWIWRGLSLNTQGKYDEAVQAWDKALERDPKNVATWCSKGEALLKQHKYIESVQSCDTALDIDIKNAEAWCLKGRALINLEKDDEAIQALNNALEIDPQLADAWYNKGLALKKWRKNDEAIQALDKALEIDPQSPAGLTKSEILSNPYYWVDKSLKLWDYNAIYPFDTSTISKEDYEEAIKCLNNAIAIYPSNTNWYYGKARIYTALSFYARDMHNYDEFDHYCNKTIETYKRAAEIDSLDPRFWMEIGEFLTQLEKYEEASSAFDIAIEVNQGKEWFHLHIWNGKLSALHGIAKKHPHDADMWYAIGNAWVKRGSDIVSMYKAILAYDKAIINRPNFVEAWNNKGLALKQWSNGQWSDESSIDAAFAMAQGKYDEAIKSYDEHIKLSSNYASAWYGKGLVFKDKGNYTEALEYFEKALELNPEEAIAYYAKGIVLKLLGSFDEADVALAKYTELETNH